MPIAFVRPAHEHTIHHSVSLSDLVLDDLVSAAELAWHYGDPAAAEAAARAAPGGLHDDQNEKQ